MVFPSSKLEKALNTGSQPDSKRKYLTGEWFYEAKSRRHMDKIHGSEIILASMKQKKAALGVFPPLCSVDKGLVKVHVGHSVHFTWLHFLQRDFHDLGVLFVLPQRLKYLPQAKL